MLLEGDGGARHPEVSTPRCVELWMRVGSPGVPRWGWHRRKLLNFGLNYLKRSPWSPEIRARARAAAGSSSCSPSWLWNWSPPGPTAGPDRSHPGQSDTQMVTDSFRNVSSGYKLRTRTPRYPTVPRCPSTSCSLCTAKRKGVGVRVILRYAWTLQTQLTTSNLPPCNLPAPGSRHTAERDPEGSLILLGIAGWESLAPP